MFTGIVCDLATLVASRFAVMASISLEGTRKKKKNGALQRIQMLLQVIQKSESVAANNKHTSLQDAIVTNQVSGILPSGEIEAACISGVHSSTVTVESAVAWRDSCEHHLEWMDPLLWSTLPRDLLELVFARLSIVKIIDLCVLSMQWSEMSKSPNFRRVFSERYPKLFELVGRCKTGEILDEVVYEVKFNDPTLRAPGFAPFLRPFGSRRVNNTKGYGIPWTESDRGLVCFIPRQKFSTVPILVGNPINDVWKALPCIPFVNKKTNKDPAIVQLVLNEDTISYQVIVMFYNFSTKEYAAYCFDCRTGEWKCEESSLTYGDVCSRLLMIGGDQCDFDRRTKMLFDLVYTSSLKGAAARGSAMFKDRLFVLYHQEPR